MKTFKRYEVKYFVTREQYNVIRAELERHMVPDKYCRDGGSYAIYNVYFDTESDDIIRHSLDKPYYKEKLRMRAYDMPTSGDAPVFLELKKKIGGIVTKRRATLSVAQAAEFFEHSTIPELQAYEDKQVLAEISQFVHRYQVEPKVFIGYQRTAFFDKDDHDFRISFDTHIRTRRENVSLTAGDYGTDLLASNQIVMEVKCTGGIPIWLCHILSDLQIYKTSFSKYGTEFKRYNAITASCHKYEEVGSYA